MSDNWSSQIDADYENGDAFREESPNGSFDYRLTTPAKATFGVGLVIARKGILSGEYEYIDYSLAKLSTPSNSATEQYDFNLENENIKSLYQPAGNIKAGLEWRLDPFRIRGGFSHRQNAFRSDVGADNSSTTYSFGLGFREADYFIDLGYSLTQFDQDHYAYSNIESPANISTTAHYLLITVGFRY
jgi:long-subunit fatty acid transport protein